MRTRTDAQQEAFARRLALVRAVPGQDEDDEDGDWWGSHTTVPVEGELPAALAQRDVGSVVVPVPGRHAARRSLGLALRPPEILRGQVRLGTAQVAVVALALTGALALTCWWLARGRATSLDAPLTPSVSASVLVPVVGQAATPPATSAPARATAPAAGTGGPAGQAGAMVTVDVEGKVRHPGIVLAPAGSRVTDALDDAGGVPHRHDLHGLNLAAVLVDGQQIVVGAPVQPVGAPSGATGGGSAGDTGTTGVAGGAALVNLNTATSEQLDTLPGVGPVTAQSILEWREQNGGFTSVQELLEVDGIGPATLEKLTPRVTV